jgi:hypothetical protein
VARLRAADVAGAEADLAAAVVAAAVAWAAE